MKPVDFARAIADDKPLLVSTAAAAAISSS